MNDYTPKFLARFWAKVLIPDDPNQCWLWQGATNSDGYGSVKVGAKTVGSHRVSYGIARGDPGTLSVLHSCDCPPCVNPRHLFLGTQLDNVLDRERKGRSNHASGETHGNCKLTDDQVSAIREEYKAGGTTLKALADVYHVSFNQISRIVRLISRR